MVEGVPAWLIVEDDPAEVIFFNALPSVIYMQSLVPSLTPSN